MSKQRSRPAVFVLLGMVVALVGGLAQPSIAAAGQKRLTLLAVRRHRIYVDEHGSGSGRGSTCANAHSVAWLDSPHSWRATGGPIGPGTVVQLCGRLSSPVTLHGSGVRGKPITILFGPGARIGMRACPGSGIGCLDTDGNHYLTLDGGTDGVIESSANGTTGATHVGDATGIWAMGCSGCVIEHLTVRDMYVHTSAGDTTPTGANGIVFSGSNLTIRDDVLHDDEWALVAEWHDGDGNIRIDGNRIYNVDHGFASTAGFNGGHIGPLLFYENQVSDYANWDTTRDAYHHDGLHCYTYGGGAAHYTGFYIYDNRFGGATGADLTAQIFIEGHNDGTPCADATSPIWIFNNVASVSRGEGDGIFTISSGVPHVLNNTLTSTAPSVSAGIAYTSNNPISGEQFLNNILNGANQLINIDTAQVSFAPGSPDYNLYADSGDNAFVCQRTFLSFTQFSRWRACVHGDSHSRTAAGAALLPGGEPETSSRAIDTGLNLTPSCRAWLEPLCFRLDGRPRLASGAWDAGAD